MEIMLIKQVLNKSTEFYRGEGKPKFCSKENTGKVRPRRVSFLEIVFHIMNTKTHVIFVRYIKL